MSQAAPAADPQLRRSGMPGLKSKNVLATGDAARREGIQAYVDGLDARERNWLYESIRMSKAADQGQSGSEEHARRPGDLGH